MKRIMIIAVLLATRLLGANADVDPNFYIYICFGQSNMEGNAQAQSVDKTSIDKRFRLLATCNYSSPSRTMGKWYDAVPPLVNPNGGLGPTDYFGRTMVAALPANVRIGVIPVAMGGSPIEMFDKDKYQQKLKDNPNEWWATLAKNHYGGNPYGRIIEMAKIAKEVGVIKGILLHQGCSNNGDPNWPNMVKKIYNDMLNDLELGADTVPLFVGETLRQDMGGSCYAHNTQVARMPSVVPTSHVVSSEGLPGNGQDPWHFNATGYRIFGKRYAFEALKLMGKELKADPDYQFSTNLKKFFEVKSVKDYAIKVGDSNPIPVTAVFGDGHTENISNEVTISSDDFTIVDNKLASFVEGEGMASVNYTDFTGKEDTYTFKLSTRLFPFDEDNFKQLSGTATIDYNKRTVTMKALSMAGWTYSSNLDLSGYKYLVVKLKEPQTCNAEVRLGTSSNVNALGYRDTINERTTIVIDLQNLKYSNNTKVLDPAKIRMVAFRAPKAGTIVIDDIFPSNDESYGSFITGIVDIEKKKNIENEDVYDILGRRISNLRKGIYVRNRKKIIVQ